MKSDYNTESMPLPNDSTAKAKRRMDLCIASSEEQEKYRYDPNGARANRKPGIPCEDYGTMTDD